MSGARYRLRTVPRIADVPAAAWDALANPDPAAFNPFLSHAFLKACEESGSATARTGWTPVHLLLEAGETLAGAMPCYLKGHSQGEYVFDHSWADALTRAGGRYYPKLLAAVPFTPVPGPRLLARGDAERDLLLGGLAQLAEENRLSSAHINFLSAQEWERAGRAGWLQRMDQQFHWENRGYGAFEDFLAALSSDRRKNLRKERARARENGIDYVWVSGGDLREAHWDAFFACYLDTGSRKWGRPYLTRAFFSLIGAAMAERILLVLAMRGGQIIAGALNFIGGDTLYGRNWGAREQHNFMHFEACYYQAIDFAIARGLKRVEAGAQGMHKLARGYAPVPTYSAHWIREAPFRTAVARYLAEERAAVAEDIETLAAHTPFRKGDRGDL